MKRYLKRFGLGSLICGNISWALMGIICMVPWELHQPIVLGACFAISGGYIMALPELVYDIVSCRHAWTNSKRRSLAVMLVGASFGLLILAWISIFQHRGMEPFHTEQFTVFLCGKGDEAGWIKARELYRQAELLAMCKVFVENFIQYATVSGALALLIVKLCDDLKGRDAQLSANRADAN